MFESLPHYPADSILGLLKLQRNGGQPLKSDLGIGVYRDAHGRSVVLQAVKIAEQILVESQQTKCYLGPEGDEAFLERLTTLIFPAASERMCAIQTPGGTGALRLALELVASQQPRASVLLGTPAWVNHQPLLAAVGLTILTYPYADLAQQRIRFDQMCGALETTRAGDVVLLQSCCHNPTGMDLSDTQWEHVAQLIRSRGLIPLIDFAYHGFGSGLTEDARRVAGLLATCDEALLAYSCSKNFGLYRERAGALFVIARNSSEGTRVRDSLARSARLNWSMPPDHGAAVVRTILESEALSKMWREELEQMALRIRNVRNRLADIDPSLEFFARQRGLFSQLGPDTPLGNLREKGFSIPESGRCNIAGLRSSDVDEFAGELLRNGLAIR